MPELAISPTFLSDFSRLDTGVQSATLTAVRAYMSGGRGHLEPVTGAPDPRVGLLRIGPEWSAVTAPGAGSSACLLVAVRPHDEAVEVARTFLPTGEPEIKVEEPAATAAPLPPLATGPRELVSGLASPFEDWRLTLHPDQRHFAHARFAGAAQVTGGPGTGKTVLAVRRAAYLATRTPASVLGGSRRTILLTTFNRLLAQTLSAQLDRLLPASENRGRVEVVTIDSLARSVVHHETGVTPVALSRDTLSERWREAAWSEGLPYSGRFLVDEWEQVILAQNLTDVSDYIRCERSGRMLHLAPEHRRQVWRTIHRYAAAMRVAGEWSYPQVAMEAARVLHRSGPRYRHVVVDEAQDLHPAQWRMLRAAVPEGPDDLFVVGDPSQRIYDNRVSLASLGVNVRGRGHRLRVSYRVTQETLDWAMPLLGRPPSGADASIDDGDDVGDDAALDAGPGALPVTPAGPAPGYRSLLHGPEPVLRGCADRSEERSALGERVEGWLRAGVRASTIAVAGRNQWVVRHMAKELAARDIPAAPLDSPDDAEAVRVGTMHKLKGQEFRCVAVIGMSEPLLPPKAAIDSAEGDPVALEQVHAQERKLLFVACTRARDALYVSYAGAPSRLLPHAERQTRVA